MGRSASLHAKLSAALPDLFPNTWGRAYDNETRTVPTSSNSLAEYIADLNAQGLDPIPPYVDKNGAPLTDSPFELKHRKRTYEQTVSTEFQNFWARVEDHAETRKKAKDPVQEAIGAVERALNALTPEQRQQVLDAVRA